MRKARQFLFRRRVLTSRHPLATSSAVARLARIVWAAGLVMPTASAFEAAELIRGTSPISTESEPRRVQPAILVQLRAGAPSPARLSAFGSLGSPVEGLAPGATRESTFAKSRLGLAGLPDLEARVASLRGLGVE